MHVRHLGVKQKSPRLYYYAQSMSDFFSYDLTYHDIFQETAKVN